MCPKCKLRYVNTEAWLSRTTLDAVLAPHPMTKIEPFLNLVQFAASLLSWQDKSLEVDAKSGRSQSGLRYLSG
jgi:hypothetical protein